MFEHWSERRRRWFLITFCSVAWALFLNGLAHLGAVISRGGIGHDAVHIAGVVGSLALIAVVAGAFKLALRHWVMAALFGISLNAALVDFGLRDHATAGIWSIECDRGNAAACAQLAEYYEAGRSLMHGWTDAELMRRRACDLGRTSSCALLRVDPVVASCNVGGRSDCVREAAELSDRGQYRAAAYANARACELTRFTESLEPCMNVLDAGHHGLREAACVTIEEVCRVSSQHACAAGKTRCAVVNSKLAGVSR